MTQDLPARLEAHAFESLTMSDRQFLLGEAEGALPARLAGLLCLAQGAQPQPAVVLMHGSGGIGPGIAAWARELNAAGFAAFLIDGFTGRGLVLVGADQAKLGRLAFVLDIYRALGLLAAHRAIDAQRLAVLGFSRGGQGALYAGMARFHRLWNPAGPVPAATAVLYPDCATRYLEDTAMMPGRLAVFHGMPDDMNPIAPARAHVERLRAAGHDARLIAYPDGHHGFDDALGAVRWQPDAQSVRHCRIEERVPGLLVNAETGAPFTYADPCVARGSHAGRDPVQGPAVRRDVLAFLAEALSR